MANEEFVKTSLPRGARNPSGTTANRRRPMFQSMQREDYFSTLFTNSVDSISEVGYTRLMAVALSLFTAGIRQEDNLK